MAQYDVFGESSLFLASYVCGRLVVDGCAKRDDVRARLLGEAHVCNLTATMAAQTIDEGLTAAERESMATGTRTWGKQTW